MIIAIEGIDASGKQTQSRLLAERLSAEGIEARRIAYPNYESKSGKAILANLKGRWTVQADPELEAELGMPVGAMALQALFTADRYAMAAEIGSWLGAGPDRVVVMDRYWQSSIAYGAADKLDVAWLHDIHRILPKADLNILIDIDPEVGLQRRPERRDRYEADPAFLRNAREAYLRLWEIEQDTKRCLLPYSWWIVDGNRSIEEVHENVFQIFRRARS